MSDAFEDGLPDQLLVVTDFNHRRDGGEHRIDADEKMLRISIKQRPDVNVPRRLLEQCYSLQIGKPVVGCTLIPLFW